MTFGCQVKQRPRMTAKVNEMPIKATVPFDFPRLDAFAASAKASWTGTMHFAPQVYMRSPPATCSKQSCVVSETSIARKIAPARIRTAGVMHLKRPTQKIAFVKYEKYSGLPGSGASPSSLFFSSSACPPAGLTFMAPLACEDLLSKLMVQSSLE